MKFAIVISVLALSGCVTSGGKTVLDSSQSKPSWVNKNKVTWEDDGVVYFKSMRSVKGNERLNACYTLSELDAKEQLIAQIKNDLKGSIDSVENSTLEDGEIVLGKVRSSEFKGSVHGMKKTEEYFERYTINAESERIDCYTLNEIKLTDYNKTKKAVLERVIEADPRIKEAITQKQIDFFKKSEGDKEAH
jgi:hypothetical protein